MQIVCRHAHRALRALADTTGDFATDGCDFSFQLTQSGFLCVALNHRQQRRSRNVEVARRDAVFFHLFWEQVPPGNLEFFFFRISGQPDHFHAISQSRLDRVENVGGRHENDVRQIERDAQIVIAKTVVLLRVEDFQQSR